MRRLVLSVLVALGLLVGSSAAADAKSDLLTYSLVTVGPSEPFPGACDYVLSWTVKDPSRVATYYVDAPVNTPTPPPVPPQPKNKDTDLPYFQVPSGEVVSAGVPGDVIYLRVLVRYTNGTYAPWQERTIVLPAC